MSVIRTVVPALLIPALTLAAVAVPGDALAGSSVDRARVVEVEPVYRTVDYQVASEQCRLVEVPVEAHASRSGYRSFTGPIVGAIVGGAIGNAVGHNKSNKKVGTAVGAILGGSIGRDLQRRQAQARYRSVGYETEEVCETVYETHERLELDGYDVTYRYAGQTHTTRLDRDPGRYLDVRVQVTPV